MKLRVEAAPGVVPQERPGLAGGKRDANRRAQASALASAALARMVERGIEAVTIDEIVQHARVAKGSYYRYYRDKEDLVAALLAPVSAAVSAAIARCRDALASAEGGPLLARPYLELAAALGAMLVEHRAVTRLYLQERRAPAEGARRPVAALARVIDEGAEQLARAASERGLTHAIDPRVSAAVVVGAAEHLAARALAGEQGLDTPEVAAQLVSIVLDGVRGRRGA